MNPPFHNEEKNTNPRVKAVCAAFLASRLASKTRVQSVRTGCFFLFETGDYLLACTAQRLSSLHSGEEVLTQSSAGNIYWPWDISPRTNVGGVF